MIVRMTPGALAAWSGVVASVGAVAGVWLNAWKTRKDVRIAQDQLTVDREEAINQRIDSIFRAYDATIADLRKEVSECRSEVDALRRQMAENNEARALAEIAASTARMQADHLLVENRGLQAALKDCSEQKASLLLQIAEKAGSPHVQTIDRAAGDSDP
jgi:chromosome segregation ATPase